MQSLLRTLGWTLCIATLSGCAAPHPPAVTDLAFWGIGWQLKGAHNRVRPAIPPVVQFLKNNHPDVRPASPATPLAAGIRRAMMGLRGADRSLLQRRLVGVFLVTGLRCGAAALPVRDGGAAVAAFVVLDVDALSGDPAGWVSCYGRSSAPLSASALGRLLVQMVKDPGRIGWIIFKR